MWFILVLFTQYVVKICLLTDYIVFGTYLLPQVLSELCLCPLALYFSAHQPNLQLSTPEFLCLRSFSGFCNMLCLPAWQVVSARKLTRAKRRPQPMTDRVGLQIPQALPLSVLTLCPGPILVLRIPPVRLGTDAHSGCWFDNVQFMGHLPFSDSLFYPLLVFSILLT